ncbi:hypothetical protein TRVL_09225 [Trypanosoma vivax]|nr:hypothetical protein TRVL_09225 [Trypanosoma vivax]
MVLGPMMTRPHSSSHGPTRFKVGGNGVELLYLSGPLLLLYFRKAAQRATGTMARHVGFIGLPSFRCRTQRQYSLTLEYVDAKGDKRPYATEFPQVSTRRTSVLLALPPLTFVVPSNNLAITEVYCPPVARLRAS